MIVLAFHNLLFEDPLANLILIGIFITGFLVSNYFVIRGALYIALNWRSFSKIWQIVLGLFPVIFFLIASTEPVHLALPSLPFGFFAGFPAIFFFTVEFGPENMRAYEVLGF